MSMVPEYNQLDDQDGSSEMFGGSSMGGLEAGDALNNKTSDDPNNQALEKTLARNESRWIRRLRLLVLLGLMAAATLSSVGVWLYMKGDEEAAFESEFNDLANRLLDGMLANSKLRLQVLDMLAISLTSSAVTTNQSWPFVLFDDFEARCTAARTITSSDYIGLYPYVTTETREDWEQYTMDNMAWLNESFAFQQDFKMEHNRTVGVRAPARRQLAMEDRYLYNGRDLQTEQTDDELPEPINATFDGTDGITPLIYRYGTDEEGYFFVVDQGPGPYYPMFQVSPAREWSAIDVNYNINDPYSVPDTYIDALGLVQTTGVAVFTGVWNVDEEGYIDENDDYDYRTVPAAALLYPVFAKQSGPDKEVVGIIEMDMEFGPLFSSVLPTHSDPMVVVASNPCGQTLSYEVRGSVTTYLGYDDLHDPVYDDMMFATKLTDFDRLSIDYNGAPVDKEFCQWSIQVYATQEMEDEYITQRPIYLMLGVLGIFLFASLIFVTYDFIVEQRQKKVLSTAVNSDQIVTSLFPKEFRDKLMLEKKEQAEREKKRKSGQERNDDVFRASSVQEFMEQSGELNLSKPMKKPDMRGPPLAELYPECTVYFADIAGFTSWSSARSPTEVFTLLETLYGGFDKIAKKFNVCKIETIGDCYLAVTGLPEPQPNHSLLMTKFARACLDTFRKLTEKLVRQLGPDTSELAMRVGMHSGPVTAGILRGEKARFQLFGDTVNTASRMESNGVKGKIHVSQETADHLASLGKGSWISPREDKIVAKGKGELQTYWVTPRSSAGSVASHVLASELASTTSDDDQADIEMALLSMPGEDNEKLEWSEANSRRVTWIIDLLRNELKQMIADRKHSTSIGAVSEDVWNRASADSFPEVADWGGGLPASLLYEGDGHPHPQEQNLTDMVDQQLVEFVARVTFSYGGRFDKICQDLISISSMLKQLDSVPGAEFVFTASAKFSTLLAFLIRIPTGTHGIHGVIGSDATGFGQKSIGFAWNLLMDGQSRDLCLCICSTETELHRFWKLTMNLLLATNKSDNHLSEEMSTRWNDAMTPGRESSASVGDKAAAVLEHLALAAHEAHYMQHWESYIKWSRWSFKEAIDLQGSGSLSGNSPATVWYYEEQTHFDTVVIPLAKRIDHSRVLRTNGREMLKLARQNRKELEVSGKEIVQSWWGDEGSGRHDPPMGSSLAAEVTHAIVTQQRENAAPMIENTRIVLPQQRANAPPIVEIFSDEVSC